MKAAVWNAAGTLDVVDRPEPERKPGSVLLRVAAVGICGTDLHFFSGAFPPPAGLLPGHEVGGVVEEASEGVELVPGTPVAVEPVVGCGVCMHCAVGQYNRCRARRLFGVNGRGGLAELMSVPASTAYALPGRLTAEDGALAEPLAVAVRGVRLAGVGLGTTVAVLGGGTIGLLAAFAARAAGASDVHLSARHAAQREMAASLGAGPLTGDDYDVVVETVGGSADTLSQAVGIARPGGTIAMLGVFGGSTPLPALDFALKELRLIGSNCYSRADARSEFEIALGLLEADRDVLRPLVTHRFGIDAVNDAFATAADKSSGAIKVQITP